MFNGRSRGEGQERLESCVRPECVLKLKLLQTEFLQLEDHYYLAIVPNETCFACCHLIEYQVTVCSDLYFFDNPLMVLINGSQNIKNS